MRHLSSMMLIASMVIVIAGITPALGQTDMTAQISDGKTGSTQKASDGSTVTVVTGHPTNGQMLAIGIGFKDSAGNFVQHQNYEITVKQDGNTVLSDPKGHTHNGMDNQMTSALSSANPVDISITLDGIGLPTADPSTWTGAKGETLTFLHVSDNPEPVMANMTMPSSTPMSNMTTTASTPMSNMTAGNATIPEFGPVASIVLAIAVLSVVVFAAKTRVIPRL